MDATPRIRLRPVTDTDTADVLRLNEEEVEVLAPMDEQRLAMLREVADRCDVIDVDGRFGGFVITIGPGAAYDSENYRWFTRRYPEGFYYLDRVVLEASVRRRGVGRAVYDQLESVAAAYPRMALEVNLVPPNLPSLLFHRGRGYVEVGRLGDEAHLVSLMVRDASGMSCTGPDGSSARMAG